MRLNVCICEEELANLKGLKLSCPMRWLSWASASQKCPDELRGGHLSVRLRNTGENFGTASDTRASSLE